MALLSNLVSVCEQHQLDTGPTLSVFARRLREAGRVSKAGRGRGAAHMTFLDAARFLIACAATDHPERAADAERVFSNTVWSNSGTQGSDFVLSEPTAPTLDVAVARLLEEIANGSIDATQADHDRARSPSHVVLTPPIFWLIVRRGGVQASLRVQDSTYHYQHPALVAVKGAPDYIAAQPLLAVYERETHRFRTGKNLHAELDATLLRAVANLIAGND